MHKSGAGPHAAPARARCANVVVHFPTWTERVAFVRSTDGIDHFSSHGVTEITETVERLEGARFAAQTVCGFVRRSDSLCSVTRAAWESTLFVPRVVRRWTSKTVARIGVKRRDKAIEPTGCDLHAGFEQHEDVSVSEGSETIEAGGSASCV